MSFGRKVAITTVKPIPTTACKTWLSLNFTIIVPWLKVHKIENFFGSEFEFCTISLLVLLKY